MAANDQDSAELLRSLREGINAMGLAELDATIMSAVTAARPGTPQKTFLEYTSHLEPLLDELTQSRYERAMKPLREALNGKISAVFVAEENVDGDDRLVPLSLPDGIADQALKDLSELRLFILEGIFPDDPEQPSGDNSPSI